MSEAEYKTYRANGEGFDGDRIRLEGEVFTTNIPKGSWMTLLDADGNEVEEPDHSPVDDEFDVDEFDGGEGVDEAFEVAELKAELAAANEKIATLEKALAAKEAKPAAAKPAAAKAATSGKAPAAGKGKKAADPLDHDQDGKKGGVADSTPASQAEKRALFEKLTDDEIRQFVTDKTKSEPAADLTREQLIDAAVAD